MLRVGLTAKQSLRSDILWLRAFSAPAMDAAGADAHPPLVKVPSLPIVGSQLKLFSGIPALNLKQDINQYFRKLHKEKGPFYSVGIPGFGTGLHGTLYVVQDPREMHKVVTSEGSFPSGK
jgi:hypothetical protein